MFDVRIQGWCLTVWCWENCLNHRDKEWKGWRNQCNVEVYNLTSSSVIVSVIDIGTINYTTRKT
jgi:hypothetical protein